jgi:ribosomal protein S18 acetylase RimI-like enzyme
VQQWCLENSIRCLYFLCDASDADSVSAAEKHRYQFVDIRVTLLKHLNPEEFGADLAQRSHIRSARPTDLKELKALARFNHRDTRFFFDKHFPAARSEALYETWIEKSCSGLAEVVLVAEVDGLAAGYVSCVRQDDERGQIGLFGIRSDLRGKGYGQQLLGAAQKWFADKQIFNVIVITQGRNCAAQRMYQRSGFLTRSVQLWYHKWFE